MAKKTANAKSKSNNPARTIKAQRSVRGNGATLGIEAELWLAADKLRGHLDAADGY